MRHTRTVAIVGLAVALTGLIGCSSSSSKSSSDTTVAGSPTTTKAAGDSDTGSSAAVDVCKAIKPAEVAAIVGGEVTAEETPGGGCSFSRSDPRAGSVSFDSTSFTGGGSGYDSAKSTIASMIKGTPEDLTGVGDQAFVVVGLTTGGSNNQGGGLVRVGDHLAQVNLIQGNGLSVDDVKAMTTKLLGLAASNL